MKLAVEQVASLSQQGERDLLDADGGVAKEWNTRRGLHAMPHHHAIHGHTGLVNKVRLAGLARREVNIAQGAASQQVG